MSLLIESQNDSNLFEQYHHDIEAIRLLGQDRFQFVPVAPNKRPHFYDLSAEAKLQTLKRLSIYRHLLSTLQNEDLYSEKQLLWYALSNLGLKHRSDLMEHLKETDYFEVYVDSTQVYRSFNYYTLCNYDVDDLENIPWSELFYRDPEIQKEMFAELHTALSTNKLLYSKTPEHQVRELISAQKASFNYKMNLIAPLTSTKYPATAFLVTLQASRIEIPLHQAATASSSH